MKTFLLKMLSTRHAPWTMAHFRLLLLTAAMLSLPQLAGAWSDFAFYGQFVQSGTNAGYYFTTKVNNNANHWSGTLTVPSWWTDGQTISFKLYNEESNGSTKNYCGDGSTWDFTSSQTVTKTVKGGSGSDDNYYMTFKHNSAYSSYTVDAEWTNDNSDGTFSSGWKVTVTGVGRTDVGGLTSLYVESGVEGWSIADSRKMTANTTNQTFTYTLDTSNYSDDYVWFRLVSTENTAGIGSGDGSNGQTITVNAAEATAATYYTSDINNKNFRFKNDYSSYTITATYSGSAWTVKVEADNAAKRATYTLTYGNGTTVTASVKNGEVEFSLPSGAYSSTSGLTFNIFKTQGTTNTYYATSSSSITTGAGVTLTEKTSGESSDGITLAANLGKQAPASNSSIKITFNVSTGAVTISYTTQKSDEDASYFVVIPDLFGNELRDDFRMQEARNRIYLSSTEKGDGKPNSNYWNLNWKRDDLARVFKDKWDKLADTDKIHWYIMKGDGSEYYYPVDDATEKEYNLGYTSKTTAEGLNSHKENYDFSSSQVHGLGSTLSTSQMYYFTKVQLKADDSESFSILLNKAHVFTNGNTNVSGSEVTFFHNGSIAENGYSSDNGFNDGTGYYLVGNFENTNGGYVQIEPDKESFRKTMTPYCYYNGTSYMGAVSTSTSRVKPTSTADGVESQWKTFATANVVSAPDSVVWQAHVVKPAEGWDYLYLGILPAGLIDYSDSGNGYWGKMPSGQSGWWYALRPQVASQKLDTESNNSYANVDSRSWQGGLFQNNAANMNQSINPDLEDLKATLGINDINDLASYDFSFNAKTSTYRLIFTIKKEEDPDDGKKEPILTFRDYKNVYYSEKARSISGRTVNGKEYQWYTCWFSPYAYTKPTNVDMFVVSGVDTSNKTLNSVTLQQLNPESYNDGTKGYYLPANTGLILAIKSGATADELKAGNQGSFTYNENDAVSTSNALGTLTYSVEKVDDGASYNGTNYLLGADQSTAQPVWIDQTATKGGTTYYNYLFSAYQHNKWSTTAKTANDFDLGFWIVNAKRNSNKTYSNDCYLELSADQVGYNIGTSTVNYKAYTTGGGAKVMPGVLLNWKFIDDDNTTGISDVAKTEDADDNAWYNLQGMRLDSRPAAPGLYIHHGKKIIVKQ